MTVRVLIADDQHLVRTGLQVILDTEPDIDVIGQASTGLEAVSMAHELRPDVVLMDIRMPELDGIEATRQITAPDANSSTRVLVLTTFDVDQYVFEALRAGASGFLLKDVPAAQLVTGVRMTAAGDALLAPSITRRLIEQFAAAQPAEPPAALDDLTPRELEVFRLLAKGMSNAEIAAQLFIGDATVKTHVTRLLMKLDLRDRVQAVVLAYETGIVRPSLRKSTDSGTATAHSQTQPSDLSHRCRARPRRRRQAAFPLRRYRRHVGPLSETPPLRCERQY